MKIVKVKKVGHSFLVLNFTVSCYMNAHELHRWCDDKFNDDHYIIKVVSEC